MMSLLHLYREFGEGESDSEVAASTSSSISQEALEDIKLEAFESGYSAGWEDALKAQFDSQTETVNAFVATLQDVSFGYHEARAGLIKAMQPVLSDIINKLLPEVAQAALGAHALGAETIVIIYVSLEVINRGDTDKYGITDQQRWLSEYVYSMDDLQSLVDDEINRQFVAMEAVNDNEPPSRHMPDMPVNASINRSKPNSGKATWTELSNGQVVDTGTHWACDYCRYQTKCQDDLTAGV